MISFLRGRLVASQMESPQGALLLIDVNGVGYDVLTHGRMVAALTCNERGTLFESHRTCRLVPSLPRSVGFFSSTLSAER